MGCNPYFRFLWPSTLIASLSVRLRNHFDFSPQSLQRGKTSPMTKSFSITLPQQREQYLPTISHFSPLRHEASPMTIIFLPSNVRMNSNLSIVRCLPAAPALPPSPWPDVDPMTRSPLPVFARSIALPCRIWFRKMPQT